MIGRTRARSLDFAPGSLPGGCGPNLLGDDAEVVVQLDWRDWRTASVRLRDLEDVHWHQPAGAPRALIHAYVWCTRFVRGGVLHDCCGGGVTPHRLHVCALRSHAAAGVYADLLLRAETERSAATSSRDLV